MYELCQNSLRKAKKIAPSDSHLRKVVYIIVVL